MSCMPLRPDWEPVPAEIDLREEVSASSP
jgi:hypothetical protein